MPRTYGAPSVQALLDRSRTPRPAGAVWHASDIDWSTKEDASGFLLTAPYPRWFLDLRASSLTEGNLDASHDGTIDDLMAIKASAYDRERVDAIRKEVEHLFVRLARSRSLPLMRERLPHGNPFPRRKPQTRKTAPRRQREKVEGFKVRPYVGNRVDLPPLHPSLVRRPRQPWTDLQKRYLHMRRHDGRTCTQIGEEMGTTKNAILSQLYRMGLLANGDPLPYPPGTPPRIRPIPTIQLEAGHPLVVKPSSQKGWTDLQVIYLISRRKAKLSASKIAAEMGTTKNTVIGKLDRLGLLVKGKVKGRIEVAGTA